MPRILKADFLQKGMNQISIFLASFPWLIDCNQELKNFEIEKLGITKLNRQVHTEHLLYYTFKTLINNVTF